MTYDMFFTLLIMIMYVGFSKSFHYNENIKKQLTNICGYICGCGEVMVMLLNGEVCIDWFIGLYPAPVVSEIGCGVQLVFGFEPFLGEFHCTPLKYCHRINNQYFVENLNVSRLMLNKIKGKF